MIKSQGTSVKKPAKKQQHSKLCMTQYLLSGDPNCPACGEIQDIKTETSATAKCLGCGWKDFGDGGMKSVRMNAKQHHLRHRRDHCVRLEIVTFYLRAAE